MNDLIQAQKHVMSARVWLRLGSLEADGADIPTAKRAVIALNRQSGRGEAALVADPGSVSGVSGRDQLHGMIVFALGKLTAGSFS